MHPYIHHSIIYNSQDIETTELPINGWMDKENVACIYTGIVFSHKTRKKSCHL